MAGMAGGAGQADLVRQLLAGRGIVITRRAGEADRQAVRVDLFRLLAPAVGRGGAGKLLRAWNEAEADQVGFVDQQRCGAEQRQLRLLKGDEPGIGNRKGRSALGEGFTA
jgi:hypothetical protein